LADLEGADMPSRLHIAEALSYRQRSGLLRQAA
jgi:predicted ATPase with chaperone activity